VAAITELLRRSDLITETPGPTSWEPAAAAGLR
jgi:hypothetical protein